MNLWNFLQWPALVVTTAAWWLVVSSSAARRNMGFWLFFLSKLLWIGWAIFSTAWGVMVLQITLLAMNVRGAVKTEAEPQAQNP